MVYVPGDLQSFSRVRILDLLCEGPIEGLVDGMKSIYLNDTPIQNTDGSFNYKFDETGVIQTALGTGGQPALVNFPSAETPYSVNVDVTQTGGGHTVTLPIGYDQVRVTVQFPNGLMSQAENGNLNGTDVSYQFLLKKGAGSFVAVVNNTVSGRAQASYEVEHEIKLDDPAATYQLKMVRVTADSGSIKLINASTWKDYTMVHLEKLTYPFSALVGVDLQAKDFGSVPRRAYDLKGLKVQIPSNYNPLTRVYSGAWDGTFTTGWTDNPAWCFYDLLTNTRYGLGRYLDATQIDKWALYGIAQLCDELVADGFGGTEPRFTCNLYLQSREEAFKVVSNLASIFRGMVYWSSGSVTAVSDHPTDPIYLFNRANVVDGMFNYQGSSRKARHNVVLVGWNDPDDGYKQKIEYVEDATGIALDGIQQTSVIAFGCTSRGQAHRAGRWMLLSERYETDTVTFRAGMEGAYVMPGDIVRIQDRDRTGNRYGGRIGTGSTTTAVVLDQGFTLTAGTWTLHVVMDDGTIESKTISSIASGVAATAAFSAAPSANTIWVATNSNDAEHLYRVLSVVEAEPHIYEVTALSHNPSLFDAVDNDTLLDPPPEGGGDPTPAGIPAPTGLALDDASYVETDGTSRYKLLAVWSPVTGATLYECQWRTASGNYQALPDTAVADADVMSLDPGDYLFRVRAKNATKVSAWTTGTHTIAAVVSDDYLTPEQKRDSKAEWDRIIADQTALDAAADAAGVSRTAYDATVTALTSYLDGLVDPDGTDAWSAGNWLDYTLTLYLGASGGQTFRTKFYDVWAAADALRNAIAVVAVAPVDTFRPAVLWDFGPSDPSGFSNVTTSASPSPDDQTARRWPNGQGKFTGISQTDRNVYIACARIRLQAGAAWVGKCWYSNNGSTFTSYRTLTAPPVGQWIIVAWDLRTPTSGSNIIGTGTVQGFQLELVSSGTCDVDWFGVGVYGAGSKADYDAAVSAAATTAMQKADWLSGGFIDGTKVLDGSILTPKLGANVIFVGNLYVADFNNLIPNGNSEQAAPSGGWPAGSAESQGISTSNPYRGTSHRRYSGSDLIVSGPIQVVKDEVWSYMGYIYGTGTLAVQYSTNGGSTWSATTTPTALNSGGTFAHAGASYGNTGSIFRPSDLHASATHFRAVLTGTGTADFDDLYLRRAMNAQMVVDGSILANAIAAGAIQTYHLSVGPMYQFRSASGGQPLAMNSDGTFAANTGTENANDKAVYMDDQRVYPSGKVKTFEAQWTGANDRGFMINLGSAWATSGLTGLRILHTGTTIAVYGVKGIGSYTAALKSATVATAGTEKLTAVFSATSGTSDTRRLVVKLDGAEVLVCSDADLTSSDPSPGTLYGGQKSGYAGLILGTHASRPPDVRVWAIGMAMGFVTIQDGVIGADQLVVDLATANVIRSTNYSAGSSGNAPTGYKLAGTAFTTTYKSGATDANCQFELGGSANLAGYKAATLADRVFIKYNRINNPSFYGGLCGGWSEDNYTNNGWFQDPSYVGTWNGASLTHDWDTFGNGTSGGTLKQTFIALIPQDSTAINITMETRYYTTSSTDTASASVDVYLYNIATDTETKIGGTWSYSGTLTIGSASWTARTGSVDCGPGGSNLLDQQVGQYAIKIVASCGISSGSATKSATLQIRKISLSF